MSNSQKIWVFWGVFAYGLALSAIYAYTIVVDHDIYQLLDRGLAVVERGELLPFGNIASSGVKVFTPGSFLSAAVGWPMLIWNTPYSSLIFIAILHAIGFFMICDVLRREYAFSLILLYAFFYWASPWRTSEVFLWNPAYLFFFISLHFWSAYKVAHQKSNKWFYSALHVISIFGALQVHSSFVILPLISLMLIVSKQVRPNWLGVVLGLALGFLSLVPYILARLQHPEFFNEQINEDSFLFRGLVYVYPFLKGIWYWIRQGAFVFPSHLLGKVGFDWIGSDWIRLVVKPLWLTITFALAGVTAIFSIYANWRFFKENNFSFKIWKALEFKKNNWIHNYIFFAFCSMLIASALTPTDTVFWHLLILYPISVLVPLFLVQKLLANSGHSKKMMILISASMLYFGVFTLFTAGQSYKHAWSGDLIDSYEQMKSK